MNLSLPFSAFTLLRGYSLSLFLPLADKILEANGKDISLALKLPILG